MAGIQRHIDGILNAWSDQVNNWRSLKCSEDGQLYIATSPGASGSLSVQGMALSGSVVISENVYPVLAGQLGSDNRVWPLKSVGAVINTNGSQILGVGPLLYDGVNWQPWRSGHADGLSVLGAAYVTPAVFNNSTLERTRSAAAASGTTGTGLLGAGVMVQGTNGVYRPLRGEVDGLNVAPQRPTLVNRSGTITASGTAQQIMAANPNRKYLLIQNTGANDLWFGFGNAQPNQPSFKLTAGGSFVMESNVVSTDAIYVYSATTGANFSAREA